MTQNIFVSIKVSIRRKPDLPRKTCATCQQKFFGAEKGQNAGQKLSTVPSGANVRANLKGSYE